MASETKDYQFPTAPEDYELYEPDIGLGAFATVYKARPKDSDKFCAVKLIDLNKSGNIQDIQKEILVMRTLRHDTIVPVYTSFVEEENMWIVMPLLDGGSCAHIIKTIHPQGFKDEIILATILKEVLIAICYMHKDALIHRDVKAGNILLSDTGVVQLADFGVAATMIESGARGHNRRTFTGTPCWMAPEVMTNGEEGYDCKADIWSFGITAMELAFGSAPYAKYQPMKVLLMTLQEAPPTLDIYGNTANQFSDCFKDLIKKCLVKDVAKRPTAKRLLEHRFFKKAANPTYLRDALITKLPKRSYSVKKTDSLSIPAQMRDAPTSWTFDKDDLVKFANGMSDSLKPIKMPLSSTPECDEETLEAKMKTTEILEGTTTSFEVTTTNEDSPDNKDQTMELPGFDLPSTSSAPSNNTEIDLLTPTQTTDTYTTKNSVTMTLSGNKEIEITEYE